MKLADLAIFGTPNPAGIPRLELALAEDGSVELLHTADDHAAGRFARVFRGFVGAGKLPKPVAVKLERAEAPAAVGRVKFINEYNTHVKVHRGARDDERSRVVRLVQFWPLPDGAQCDQLPPTIICPDARAVVTPVCPRCDKPYCETQCDRRCQTTPDEVLAHSRSVRCCERGTQCRAYWLNHRTCKLLLLDRLDLDLGDYVDWRWKDSKPQPRTAWTYFRNHHLPACEQRKTRLGLDATAACCDELRFLLGLFREALTGVGELHGKGIPHLDLKPANLCLSLERENVRLNVIDLGQADDPDVAWTVREQSIRDDADRRLRATTYSAPEQLPDRFVSLSASWREAGSALQVFVPTRDQTVDVEVGDWLYFPPHRPTFHRVVQVDQTGRGVKFIAARLAPNAPWEHLGDKFFPFNGRPWQGPDPMCVVQHAGFAADVFALGMLLVFLITRGRFDLQRFRQRLDATSAELRGPRAIAAGLDRLPPRASIDWLTRHDTAIGPALKSILEMCPGQPLNDLYRDLLGMALRATLRGVPRFSYVDHRGALNTDVLTPLVADLRSIRNRLSLVIQSHDLQTGRVARFRRRGLDQLRQWLHRRNGAARRASPGDRRPPYDAERICYALDMRSVEAANNDREFRFLLEHYRGRSEWLRLDLDIFARELDRGLLGAKSVHPVVLRMFDNVFPPKQVARPLRKLEVLLAANRKSARHVLARLRAAVDLFDRRTGRGDLTEPLVDDVTQAVEQLESLLRAVGVRLQTVTRWQQHLDRSDQTLMAQWERLETEATGWQAFGRKVRVHLFKADRELRKWQRRMDRAERSLVDCRRLTQTVLIGRWTAQHGRARRGIRGWFRAVVSWVRRAPVRVRIHIPAADLEQLDHSLRRAERALSVTHRLPPSFHDRLSACTASHAAPDTGDNSPPTAASFAGIID